MLDSTPIAGNGVTSPSATDTLPREDFVAPAPRVVLIRGCPRSGTTMLAELVNASPRAGILYEYGLGQLVRDLHPSLSYAIAHRSLRALLGGARAAAESRADAYFNVPRNPPLKRFPTPERFHTIVQAAVEASLAKHGLDVIGSKTPGAMGSADRAALETYFPRISYLFSVRNPLGTINSMLNRRNLARLGVDDWPWHDVTASIREYRQNARLLFSHVAAFGDDVFMVKYEDMVTGLDRCAGLIGHFLDDLPFDYGDASPLGPRGYLRRTTSDTKLVLTADEHAQVQAEFGEAIATWDARTLTGRAPAVVDALTDCLDPMRAGTKYTFESAAADRHFLGTGWSELETDGVWSDAERAHLFFTVDADADYVAYIEATPYVPGARPVLGLSIDVDGNAALRATFCASGAERVGGGDGTAGIFTGPGRKGFTCGPFRLAAGRAHRMTFVADDPRSPLECEQSADGRRLAVMLHSVLLVRA